MPPPDPDDADPLGVCVHIHQSGSAHATRRQWEAMLDRHAESAHVITLTEVSLPVVRDVLAGWAAANDWQLWHPKGSGDDECAILSRRPITRRRARRLTELTLRTARKAPIHAVSGRTYGVGWHVWHAPAHTDGLSRVGRYSWPTKVYLSALDGLTGRKGVVAGDWNLDLTRQVNRRRLRLPGLRWSVGRDQAPTHGDRVIDGEQASVTLAAHTATLAECEGFDHAGTVTVYDLAA